MTEPTGVQQIGRIQNSGRAQALPPELLSEIFLIASHGITSRNHFGRDWPRLPHEETVYIEPSLNTLPCTLTRVCKSWRRAALTTSTLWSHIIIFLGEGEYPDPGPDFSLEANHKMVSTWLRLSRHSPLYVCLLIEDDLEFPDDLWESMNRWCGLKIYDQTSYYDTESVLCLLDQTLPDRAKDLWQLEFNSDSEPHDICLSKFPNLEHVSGMLNVIPEPITKHQLKSFEASWTPSDSLQMMALFPSLTNLILEFDDFGGEWVPPSNITAMKEATSQIQDLLIIGEGISLISILSCTAFPAVCNANLTLKRENEGIGNRLQKCFSYFFQECSSTLTRLDLRLDMPFEHQTDIIKTLCHAASITHLNLNLRIVKDDFLHALEWCDSREENLCPSLVSVNIYIQHEWCLFLEARSPLWDSWRPHVQPQFLNLEPHRISLKQLIRTVRSRMEKNSSMKVQLRLRVDKATSEFLSASDELRSLQEQGVLQLDLYRDDPTLKL